MALGGVLTTAVMKSMASSDDKACCGNPLFGVKKCMIIGAAGQCAFVLLAIGPACGYNGSEIHFVKTLNSVVIISTIFTGLGQAVLWISSATYVAFCAAPTN